jgi:diguanylate cyclase (GGDEF)-like protein
MDDLTGLLDGREFSSALANLSADDRTSLVLFDVDQLHALNDQHGVERVDDLLRGLGAVIQERCGSGEVAARIGGEEFAWRLVEEDGNEVRAEVERIRHRFGEESGGETVSVGIADVATLQRQQSRLSLLEAAHDALDEAKRGGPGGLQIYGTQT